MMIDFAKKLIAAQLAIMDMQTTMFKFSLSIWQMYVKKWEDKIK